MNTTENEDYSSRPWFSLVSNLQKVTKFGKTKGYTDTMKKYNELYYDKLKRNGLIL